MSKEDLPGDVWEPMVAGVPPRRDLRPLGAPFPPVGAYDPQTHCWVVPDEELALLLWAVGQAAEWCAREYGQSDEHTEAVRWLFEPESREDDWQEDERRGMALVNAWRQWTVRRGAERVGKEAVVRKGGQRD